MNDEFRILHKRLAATENALSALGRAYQESVRVMTTALQQIDLAQQDLARRLTAVEAGQRKPEPGPSPDILLPPGAWTPVAGGYRDGDTFISDAEALEYTRAAWLRSQPEHVNGG